MPPQRPVPFINLTIGTLQVCPLPSLRRKEINVAGQETPSEAESSSACPDCGTEMVIIHIKPILFVSEFEELTLACQKCGSTKILKIKRS